MVKKKLSKDEQLFKVNEELKEAKAELSVCKGENVRLTRNLLVASQLTTKLLKGCKTCGKKMLTINWNTKVHVVACDNEKCTQYRVPIEEIEKEPLQWLLRVGRAGGSSEV